VQGPTRYELMINLKAAKTLGLVLPQSIVARAERSHSGQSRSSTVVDTVASGEPMKPPQKGQSRPNTAMPSLRRPATVR
jgi:hypothetical protein